MYTPKSSISFPPFRLDDFMPIFSLIFLRLYSETRTNSIVPCMGPPTKILYKPFVCAYKAHKRQAIVLLKQRAYNRCTCLIFSPFLFRVAEKDCCYKMVHCPNAKENTRLKSICVCSNRWPRILFFLSLCDDVVYTAVSAYNGSYLQYAHSTALSLCHFLCLIIKR